MWLYYFLIGYIYIGSVCVYKRDMISQVRRNDRDILFIFITMGVLLFLNCMRGLYVGNDTVSYYKLFNYYSLGYTNEQYSNAGFFWMDNYVDIGWRYFNVLFSKISNNYQLFISCVAIFLYLFTSKFIKRYSTNTSISILLFFLLFYHQYLNVLRQAVAIVIILMAHKYLVNKRIVRFVFAVLIATLFHKYAIVSLALIPISLVSFNKHKSRIAIIISIIMALSGGVFLLPRLFGYTGGYINNPTGISTVFSFVLNSVIYICSELLINTAEDIASCGTNENATVSSVDFYRWINLIALCLSILEIALPALYRVEYFFVIYQIVGIPYFVSVSKHKKETNRTILIIMIFTLIVYQTGIFIFRPEWITDFPYYFYWQVQ